MEWNRASLFGARLRLALPDEALKESTGRLDLFLLGLLHAENHRGDMASAPPFSGVPGSTQVLQVGGLKEDAAERVAALIFGSG